MKYDPQALMDGMSQKNLLLSAKNTEYAKLSEKKAEAERIYNIAVATETLRLKSEGMAITVIPTLVKGTESVANKKYDYDVATAVLGACKESMMDTRSAIDSYRTMLSFLKEELQRSGIQPRG